MWPILNIFGNWPQFGLVLNSVTHYIRDASGNILATYDNAELEEFNIYGSSRLGNYRPTKDDYGKLILGSRNYELTNHLGNVLAVISDKKYS